jgi:hypothetical protein
MSDMMLRRMGERAQAMHTRLAYDLSVETVASVMDLSPEAVRRGGLAKTREALARRMSLYAAVVVCQRPMRRVAVAAAISTPGVSKAVAAIEDMRDGALGRIVDELELRMIDLVPQLCMEAAR